MKIEKLKELKKLWLDRISAGADYVVPVRFEHIVELIDVLISVHNKEPEQKLEGKISNCCQSNVLLVDCDEADNCNTICGSCGEHCGFWSVQPQKCDHDWKCDHVGELYCFRCGNYKKDLQSKKWKPLEKILYDLSVDIGLLCDSGISIKLFKENRKDLIKRARDKIKELLNK